LDLEADLHVLADQLDVAHLAGLDAGDADLVVRVEAGRLGEVGLVRRTAADEGQLGNVEGGEEQHQDDRDADGTDRDRIALAERLH